MVLDDAQLLDILKNNPSKQTLTEARKQASLMNMHITGKDLKQSVTMLDYFEDEQKKNIRQKYARSNKDLFARLHRPIDKIFRAKGGGITFNMPDTAQKEFNSYLQDIRFGMSLRKWIQQVALPAFQIDPMGLIFMEINTENGPDGKQYPYPTYKSTTDIFDYKINGRQLEYVIFKLSTQDAKEYIYTGISMPDDQKTLMDARLKGVDEDKKKKLYRVVDDMTDRIIEYDGVDSVTVWDKLSLPNYFLEVPALIISDIISFDTDIFLSPDYAVVDLANDFLTDCSVFNIWKKLHGFPKAWRFRSLCSTCMGNRQITGRQCPDCKGTGYRLKSTPRDEIIIPLPEDGNTAKIPDKFGGYITPDIEGWHLMTGEMERIEYLMFHTIWGTCKSKSQTSGPATGDQKTATEAVLDVQAMTERLNDFREWAQTLETAIIDYCGQIMYKSSYEGVSDNWGDRFVLEGPDVIWQKYSDARSKGAPKASLDGLLRDYYESRYCNMPLDLAKSMMLIKVEPFTHLTEAQVEQMTITDLDKCSKLYFSEWVSTMDMMDIIMGDPDKLRQELLDWCDVKLTTIKAEEAAALAQQQLTDSLDAAVQRSTAMRVTS